MSSRGYLVDAMYSIGEKTALCSHIIEKIVSCDDKQELTRLETKLKKVLLARREQMSFVVASTETPKLEEWCDFKHALESFTHDREVYEATFSKESLEVLKLSGEILAMETSEILGMEFETCLRCVSDRILVEQHEKQEQKT